MKISIDSDGNVQVDTVFVTTNIDSITTKNNELLNKMKPFDGSQIELLKNALNSKYPQLVNFSEFLDEWQDVIGEVEL